MHSRPYSSPYTLWSFPLVHLACSRGSLTIVLQLLCSQPSSRPEVVGVFITSRPAFLLAMACGVAGVGALLAFDLARSRLLPKAGCAAALAVAVANLAYLSTRSQEQRRRSYVMNDSIESIDSRVD